MSSSAAAAALAETKGALLDHLTYHGITATTPVTYGPVFLQYVTDCGMEALSDFVGHVSSGSYEEEWKGLLVFKNPAAPSDDACLCRNLWARVKKAWSAAHLAQKKAESIASNTSVGQAADDMDDALSDTVRASLQMLWTRRHNLPLKPDLRPSDRLVGRVYRERLRGCHSVINIRRVKALVHAAEPDKPHRVALGTNTYITFNDQEGRHIVINGVVDYYWCLRTLGYAYAIAGIEEVDSVATFMPNGTPVKVTHAPLDINLNYADDSLRMAMAGGGGEDALRWLEDRDFKTRTTMMTLMREGFPQGEALTESLKKHNLDWYHGPKHPKVTESFGLTSAGGVDMEDIPMYDDASAPRRPPPKKTVSQTRGAGTFSGICKAHNSRNGCGKQKTCPQGAQHICSVSSGGKMCGSLNHNAAGHAKAQQPPVRMGKLQKGAHQKTKSRR